MSKDKGTGKGSGQKSSQKVPDKPVVVPPRLVKENFEREKGKKK